MQKLVKISAYIIAAFSVLLLSFIVKDNLKEKPYQITSQNKDDQLFTSMVNAANEINKRLPMLIDSNTRLDRVVPQTTSSRSFIYLFTIMDATSGSISIYDINKSIGRSIVNGVCTSKEMSIFIDNNIKAIYRYKDKDGNVIGDIAVSKKDCNN